MEHTWKDIWKAFTENIKVYTKNRQGVELVTQTHTCLMIVLSKETILSIHLKRRLLPSQKVLTRATFGNEGNFSIKAFDAWNA